MPSEPRPQPPYAEPLSVHVEGGLAVATVVKESATLPLPAATAVIEEEQMVR
jgi:hypothetical protein